MSPKDNVQLIVSIKKKLIGYFIEARIINQYFLNDFSIIYFKRILRKKNYPWSRAGKSIDFRK